MGFFNKKKKTKKQSPSKPKTPQPKPNKWRAEEGVDEPLRVGRGIRTRDEFFAGQEGKDVHPEIDKRELYRRSVVLDIDDEQNLAVTKYIHSNRPIIRAFRTTLKNEDMSEKFRPHRERMRNSNQSELRKTSLNLRHPPKMSPKNKPNLCLMI